MAEFFSQMAVHVGKAGFIIVFLSSFFGLIFSILGGVEQSNFFAQMAVSALLTTCAIGLLMCVLAVIFENREKK